MPSSPYDRRALLFGLAAAVGALLLLNGMRHDHAPSVPRVATGTSAENASASAPVR